jgi:hypothetical protein
VTGMTMPHERELIYCEGSAFMGSLMLITTMAAGTAAMAD